MRQLADIRKGKRKAISMRVLDRAITTSGVGNLYDFTFFTAEDLVKLGIWKAPRYVEGTKRIQGGETTEATKKSRVEREKEGRKRTREKKLKGTRQARKRQREEVRKWAKRRKRGMW
jgi:hypothetical protein